jgi:hypothetical protein
MLNVAEHVFFVARNLLWAIILYFVLAYVSIRHRNERWVLTVWIPVVAGCAMLISGFVLELILNADDRILNRSYTGMFYQMCLVADLLPAIVTGFVLSMYCPPRRVWTTKFAVIGIAAAICLPFLAIAGYHQSRLSVLFVVTDQNGKPVEHVGFSDRGG